MIQPKNLSKQILLCPPYIESYYTCLCELCVTIFLICFHLWHAPTLATQSRIFQAAVRHLVITRILPVIRIYLCRLLRTTLPSSTHSLIKYFDNWYLTILQLFVQLFHEIGVSFAITFTLELYRLDGSHYRVEYSTIWMWRNRTFMYHRVQLSLLKTWWEAVFEGKSRIQNLEELGFFSLHFKQSVIPSIFMRTIFLMKVMEFMFVFNAPNDWFFKVLQSKPSW